MNKSDILSTYKRIFFVTLKIGAFTFGGGYAMIPLMQDEFVDKHHWIKEQDIIDVFVLAQSLPGVIAVNTSLLVGYKIAGLAGGLIAAAGVILPSFVILCAVALFYQAFISNPITIGVLRGISAAVVALMLSAVLRLRGKSVYDCPTAVMTLCALGLALFFRQLSAIYIILGGALGGLIMKTPGLIKKRGE